MHFFLWNTHETLGWWTRKPHKWRWSNATKNNIYAWVQIECLGCKFFDAVQTHQVKLKTSQKSMFVFTEMCHTQAEIQSTYHVGPHSLLFFCCLFLLSIGWEKLFKRNCLQNEFCKRDTTYDTLRVHSHSKRMKDQCVCMCVCIQAYGRIKQIRIGNLSELIRDDLIKM